jgi:phage portal protein BeeE
MSELKSAAARSVCGLNECDGFTATIMRNMGIVPFVIAPAFEGGRIGVDEADQMREQWRERTTGEQRGFPWINPGSFKVEKLGGTPEEMALDKIPARFEDQISALTGVPAMVAGLTSGAQHRTYANWGEARRAFYEDTLIPMQAAVAECLEHNLLDDPGMGNSETETIAFSYDRILCLREDQNAIWTRGALAYEKGGIKRSEYRDMIGLDWDDEDDVYFVEPGGTGDGIDPSEENQGVVGDTADDDTKRETDEDEDAQGAAKKALALMGPRRNGHAHVKDPLMATVGRVLSKIEERMGREL